MKPTDPRAWPGLAQLHAWLDARRRTREEHERVEPEPSVPFATDAHGGFSSCRGLVRLAGDRLVLELEVKLLDLFGTGVREVDVPLDEIEEVEYGARLLGPRLRLRARSLRTFAEVPGRDGVRLVLAHKAEDDDAVRALHEAITRRMAARRRH